MVTINAHFARALWPTLYSKFWLTPTVGHFFGKSQLGRDGTGQPHHLGCWPVGRMQVQSLWSALGLT